MNIICSSLGGNTVSVFPPFYFPKICYTNLQEQMIKPNLQNPLRNQGYEDRNKQK
jgi:hypothetical protein